MLGSIFFYYSLPTELSKSPESLKSSELTLTTLETLTTLTTLMMTLMTLTTLTTLNRSYSNIYKTNTCKKNI